MNADGKTRDPGKDGKELRSAAERAHGSGSGAPSGGRKGRKEADGAACGGTPQAGVARKRRDEAGRLPFRPILASPGLRKRLGLRGTRTRALITTALRASSKRTRSRPEPAPAPVAGARNVARGLPTPRDLSPARCPPRPLLRWARVFGPTTVGPPPSHPRRLRDRASESDRVFATGVPPSPTSALRAHALPPLTTPGLFQHQRVLPIGDKRHVDRVLTNAAAAGPPHSATVWCRFLSAPGICALPGVRTCLCFMFRGWGNRRAARVAFAGHARVLVPSPKSRRVAVSTI